MFTLTIVFMSLKQRGLGGLLTSKAEGYGKNRSFPFTIIIGGELCSRVLIASCYCISVHDHAIPSQTGFRVQHQPQIHMNVCIVTKVA
jgi:hypothetical protein